MRHTPFIHILCALLFIAFVFLYLYCYQVDVMVVTQHLASGGKTRYAPLTGAVLITVVLYVIQLGVFALTKLRMRFHALTYLPSLLVLAFITGLPVDAPDGIGLGNWIWIFPVVLLVFSFIVFVVRNYQEIEPEPYTYGFASQLVWTNLALLNVMFVVVGLTGNHDEEFHDRAKAERLMADGMFDDAYDITLKMDNDTPETTMLRAYALSCNRELGEKLFEHPLADCSKYLVPDGVDVRTLVLPQDVIARKARTNVDYVLCRFLMDRDLPSFVRVLKRYHKPSRSLPKHYGEALILYSHEYGNHGIAFEDENMEGKYARFVELDRMHGGSLEMEFGDTYWYYYRKEKI